MTAISATEPARTSSSALTLICSQPRSPNGLPTTQSDTILESRRPSLAQNIDHAHQDRIDQHDLSLQFRIFHGLGSRHFLEDAVRQVVQFGGRRNWRTHRYREVGWRQPIEVLAVDCIEDHSFLSDSELQLRRKIFLRWRRQLAG